MRGEWLSALLTHYNWPAGLTALASVILITKVGKWLIFKVPALSDAREKNRSEDKVKWAKEKYPPIVRATQKVGMYCNLALYALILPFCVTLEAAPVWKIVQNIFIILMFYDFLYYCTHRFWFHGNGAMRQVHAVHHQARNPTYLDAHYVHPLETFIGLALFTGSVAFLAALLGPFNIVTMVVVLMVFYQLNQINHTYVDLPYFPYKTLTWITRKHHIHHENMHKGNYASLTMVYDKMFGTLD
jgi:sterol desaturase/sphingolipid hydroxylase (fatty acid hydroxylase superfamily)